jgi:hypothetical protein
MIVVYYCHGRFFCSRRRRFIFENVVKVLPELPPRDSHVVKRDRTHVYAAILILRLGYSRDARPCHTTLS